MADRESFGSRIDRVRRITDRVQSLWSSIAEEEDLTQAEMIGIWVIVLLDALKPDEDDTEDSD